MGGLALRHLCFRPGVAQMNTVQPFDAESVARRASTLAGNVHQVIKGKPEVIRLALVCLLAEGHLLVEDVPGVGKTQLARALAVSIDASSHRVQFTPDLLPSDVTGVTIFNQQTRQFVFHPGPVFANIVLADEINRASPKTQSALLEVMEERQVSVDGATYQVPRPFVVIATQNPVDMDGTYPLPEAQLDRFLVRTRVGYPNHEAEMEILAGQKETSPLDRLSAVVSADEVRSMVAAIPLVYAADGVRDYLVRMVAATRSDPRLRLPVSPRGSVALLRGARAHAVLDGRNYVTPEDVKTLAVPILAHRVILTPETELAGTRAEDVIAQIAADLPVPHAPVQR